jgi:hypothetical protein
MSTGEFRVNGGIPCRQGNSMSTGEFHVDGGIPCVSTGNSMLTEFRGYLTAHLFGKKLLKSVLTTNIIKKLAMTTSGIYIYIYIFIYTSICFYAMKIFIFLYIQVYASML